MVPRLTWSTTPVATSCTAGGAWSGTKFASGSETLAAITANKTYTLTCTWGNGSATINWTRPTTNTDGSALTNLAGYKVLYGTSASALTNVKQINNPATTSTSIAALQTGTWYFSVRAFNTSERRIRQQQHRAEDHHRRERRQEPDDHRDADAHQPR